MDVSLLGMVNIVGGSASIIKDIYKSQILYSHLFLLFFFNVFMGDTTSKLPVNWSGGIASSGGARIFIQGGQKQI